MFTQSHSPRVPSALTCPLLRPSRPPPETEIGCEQAFVDARDPPGPSRGPGYGSGSGCMWHETYLRETCGNVGKTRRRAINRSEGGHHKVIKVIPLIPPWYLVRRRLTGEGEARARSTGRLSFSLSLSLSRSRSRPLSRSRSRSLSRSAGRL